MTIKSTSIPQQSVCGMLVLYDTTYYVNDTTGNHIQVVAETDKDGKETASYTRGDEILSMERDGKIWYYIYDGHGSTRLLTNDMF